MALLTKGSKTKNAINTKNTPVRNQPITLPNAYPLPNANPHPTTTPTNYESLLQTAAANAATANSTANTSNVSVPLTTSTTGKAPTTANTNKNVSPITTKGKGVPIADIKKNLAPVSTPGKGNTNDLLNTVSKINKTAGEGIKPFANYDNMVPTPAPSASLADTLGGTGSGGGSGSGGGPNGSNGTNGLDGISGVMPSGTGLSGDLYDLFNQRLNEYNTGFNGLMQALADSYNTNNSALNSQYQSLLDALNNNYNTNNSALDDQYNAVLKALGLNLDDTTNLLDSRLKAAQDALEEQRRRSLQEAYISRMMNQRSLRDQLAASGLTGGATETVLANLLNNYQNSRNNIERDTQTNLRELLQTYLENMSEARQKYNTGVADAENYRANARQNLANSLLNQQQSIANSRASAIQALANSLLNQQQNALNYYQNNRASAWDDLFNTVAKMYLANM